MSRVHLRVGPFDATHVTPAIHAVGGTLAPHGDAPGDALVVVDPHFLGADPIPALRAFAADHPDATLAVMVGGHHPIARPALADILELPGVAALVPRGAGNLDDTLHALAHAPRFGLERFQPTARWATDIAGSDAREDILEAVQAFLGEHHIRARMAGIAGDAIEELITNAVYDAPVDANGQRLYVDTDRRSSVTLAPGAQARLEVAVHGTTVYAAMTDPHGSLEPSAVRRYLVDGLRGAISDKPGGAGLGFARVYGLVDRLAIHVVPRLKTEVVVAIETAGARRDPAVRPTAFVATRG